MHVDDRLPCTRDGAPLYSRCENLNHIYIPILEKAYAKLHGCYENLEHGYIDAALSDLSAGSSMINKISLLENDVKISYL